MVNWRTALAPAGLELLSAASLALLVLRARDRRQVRRSWHQLLSPSRPPERFEASMVDALPEPARRYLLHAIQPGAPLAEAVVLEMGGALRLQPGGPWLPMRARQVLAPPRGFVWEAAAQQGPLRFSGADFYLGGRGATRFRLWGLIPFLRAGGPDVSRSARGRLAGEAVWNPAALLPQRGTRWEAVDDRTARATLTVDGEPIPLTLAVEPDGRLRSVLLQRWGNQTEDRRYALVPFGLDVLEERAFDGYTLPSRAQGGWWYGTERYFDFFHPELRRAELH